MPEPNEKKIRQELCIKKKCSLAMSPCCDPAHPEGGYCDEFIKKLKAADKAREG